MSVVTEISYEHLDGAIRSGLVVACKKSGLSCRVYRAEYFGGRSGHSSPQGLNIKATANCRLDWTANCSLQYIVDKFWLAHHTAAYPGEYWVANLGFS